MPTALRQRKSEGLIYDGFSLFFLFLFVTGGGWLFTAFSLEELIQTKPWIHRAVIAFFTMVWIIWTALLTNGFSEFSAGRSFLITKATDAARHHPRSVLWFLFTASFFLWTAASWARLDSLSAGFDMALFTQTIWNMTQGHGLYSSIKGGINILGDHFSPILLVFSLPYRFWPDPRALLMFQAAASAACIFPLYRISMDLKKSGSLALIWAIAFLLYLPNRNAVRFEFHPEVLAMPFFLWAFYFFEQKKPVLSSLCLLVCLSAKENAALVTFAFGVYALLKRERFFGLFWAGASLLWFWMTLNFFIPHFSGSEYFYLKGNFLAWREEGTSAFLSHFAGPGSLIYLIKIFAPVAFLSFLAPAQLFLTLPMLFQNLIARNEAVRSIFFQYTVFLTPFVFISAVYGSSKIKNPGRAAGLILAASLLMAGVSDFFILRQYQKETGESARRAKKVLGRIPAEASLRTHEFLAPHGAHRRELHIYENTHPREGGRAAAMNADYVVLDASKLGDSPEEHYQRLAVRGYIKISDEHGISVFKK